MNRRLGSKFAAVALAVFLVAGCESAEERVEKHLQRGLALVEQGDLVKAQLEFRNVLKLERDNPVARFEMAKIAERNGDLGRALGHYQSTVESNPENVEAQIKIAQLAMLGGDVQRALQATDAAYALTPEDPTVLATRAALLWRTGDEAEALDSARRAVAADPDSTSAHIILLTDLARRSGPAAAIAGIDGLLERMPLEAALNFFKLQLLGQTGDEAGVEAHLRVMVERFPQEAQLRRALAQVLVGRGDIDEAEAEMRAIAELSPEDIQPRLDVVRLLYGMRGFEAARTELQTLVAAAATGDAAVPLRLALADIELRNGDAEAATHTLEAAVAAAETRSEGDRARVALARIALGAGDRKKSEALTAEILEADPDNVEALAIRAGIAIETLDLQSAIIDLRRAQNLAPESATLLALEARALDLDGNPALALERLAAAARVSSFAPEHALAYAQRLASRDQLIAAEAALAEAARRNPKEIRVLAALAEVRLRLGDGPGATSVAAQIAQLETGENTAQQIVAAALAAEGRIDEGIEQLETMVIAPEGEQTALASLVRAYIAKGEIDRAGNLLDDLIARNPANLRALALQADLRLREGNVVEAERSLRAMIEAAPQSPAGYLLLTRLQTQTGRIGEAESTARTGSEATNAGDLRLSLASLLEQRGAMDEAIQIYESLFEGSPGSMIVANNLASLLAEYRENDPEAIERAERVARRLRSSDQPFFQDTYGWIAFLRGNPEEALRVLEPAAAALPDNPLVRYHVGRVYAARNQPDLARSHLEAALALNPNFPKAASAQAALESLPASN